MTISLWLKYLTCNMGGGGGVLRILLGSFLFHHMFHLGLKNNRASTNSVDLTFLVTMSYQLLILLLLLDFFRLGTSVDNPIELFSSESDCDDFSDEETCE